MATATPSAPGSAPAALQAVQRRPSGGTIRVDLDRIDRLMNLVGEIVITQSMLSERAGVLAKREAASFVDALFSLARQTRELQDNVMAVRAQPVKVVFQRLPRLVRELERTLGKKAHLVLAGEDTEVDKTIVEELADPLIHMLRNSMDHGLETPEERIAAGKAPDGTIRVSAEHRGVAHPDLRLRRRARHQPREADRQGQARAAAASPSVRADAGGSRQPDLPPRPVHGRSR